MVRQAIVTPMTSNNAQMITAGEPRFTATTRPVMTTAHHSAPNPSAYTRRKREGRSTIVAVGARTA